MNLYLDPGAKKAGVALFEPDGRLMAAWLSKGADWMKTADNVIARLPVSAIRVHRIGIEKMQIYDSTPLAHANDCIILSLMAGRVVGLLSRAHVVEYLPRQWKGQVPKKIMTERIKSKVAPEELPRIQNKNSHDVWDAVGIGIYDLRGVRNVQML